MPTLSTMILPLKTVLPDHSLPLARTGIPSSEISSKIIPTITTMKKVIEDSSSEHAGPSSVPNSGSPEMTAHKQHQGKFTTPDNIQRAVGGHAAQSQKIGDDDVTPSFAQSVTPSSVVNVESSICAVHGIEPSAGGAHTSTSQINAISKTALSHDAAEVGNVSRSILETENESAALLRSPSATAPTGASKAEQSKEHSQSKAGTRTTTPVPQSCGHTSKGIVRTPVRSPMNGGYTFNSDLPNFASPSIFLSPYVPSPPEALDKKGLNCGECDRETRHSGIMSSNFASDFDKTELSDDTLNNVLPWLSPNAYGLFSPAGGLSKSITPSAIKNTHTNFSLPLEGSSRNRVAAPAGGGFMICVSPLARKNGTSSNSRMKHPDTPINFHEVFASPKSDYRSHYQTSISNEIPSISKETKMVLQKSVSDRSLKEDEDLNVLLDLAKTTPRNDTDAEGTRVFRGAGGAFAYPAGQPVGPPSFLHLPIIGKHATTAKKGGNHRIQKKTSSSPKKKKSPKQPLKKKHPLPSQIMNHPPPGYYPPPYMHPAAAAAAAVRTPFPYSYPSSGGQAPVPYMYSKTPLPTSAVTVKGLKKKVASKTTKPSNATASSSNNSSSLKRPLASATPSKKRVKKESSAKGRGPGKRKAVGSSSNADKTKSAAAISAINNAAGKKNNKAASLAAAVLRGVTMRPSGKWQAQLYFAGKSRYIGVFDSREKAALAYEIAREHLQDKNAQGSKDTESHVNAARKAAFEGVNEKDPRILS